MSALRKRKQRAGQDKHEADAASHPSIAICQGQPIPAGFVIVGSGVNGSCPNSKTWLIRKPLNPDEVCQNSPIPDGYVIVGSGVNGSCPNSQTWKIKQPGVREEVDHSSPIPAGYAITGSRTKRTLQDVQTYIIEALNGIRPADESDNA